MYQTLCMWLKLAASPAGLVQAIIAETLGMSAGALGGIHLVLAGPSAAVASSSQVSHLAEQTLV